MDWTAEPLTVNMEYKHGVLFAQTVARMRYLKEQQLAEVHRIVSDMWKKKREAYREQKAKENYVTPTENDLY